MIFRQPIRHLAKIVFLLLACAPLAVIAQRKTYNIRGQVINAFTGKPMAGASIFIQDARLGVATDTAGRYFMRNVPPGHHLLEASHTGFSTQVVHADVSADKAIDISLQPSVTENQGVTVTGVSNATSVRRAAIPVDVVSRSQLLQTPASNIVDALAHTPGIAQIGTGPAISKPVIRGLGYNRVIVVNDGVRQEGQQWGDEHGLEMDDASIQKAEILKGPASLMYGSDAIAGVINLMTNLPVAEGTIKANVLGNYQTNSRLQSYHANVAGAKGGFNWNAYGTLKSAGDYANKWDGRVLNSRFSEKNAGGYFGLNRSWGYSHVIISSFHQKTGIVEGDRDSATGLFLLYPETALEHVATVKESKGRTPLVPFQDIRHRKVAWDNNINIGSHRLKVNLGLQQNDRKELGNPEDASEAELAFRLRTFTYNLQWHLPEWGAWRTTAGITGMRQQNKNGAEERIIPDYAFTDVGGFLFAQGSFEKYTVSGGLRFDNRHINGAAFDENGEQKFAAFSRNFSAFSGSAGIAYEPSEKLTLKTNFASGFRAPNLAELASNGAHEGTNRYEYGSISLKPEQSFQWDASVHLNTDHIDFSVDGFVNRVAHFIYYSRLQGVAGTDSLVEADGEELQAFQFGQGNALLYGFEATADLHPHPLDWLHFENSFSFVRGRFDDAVDGTRNLPLIPAPKWGSELRANFTSLGKHLANVYCSLELNRFFAQRHAYTAYGTETETPAYTLLHAGVGAAIMAKNKTLFNLYVAAQNLTDVAYQSHLSRLKYAAVNNVTGRAGVFNTGRNYSVKLLVPLQFAWK